MRLTSVLKKGKYLAKQNQEIIVSNLTQQIKEAEEKLQCPYCKLQCWDLPYLVKHERACRISYLTRMYH